MAIIYLDDMCLSSAWPTGSPLLMLVVVVVADKDQWELFTLVHIWLNPF